MTSDSQKEKTLKASLERTRNAYEQAKTDGNTKLMKMYKSMLDKAENEIQKRRDRK